MDCHHASAGLVRRASCDRVVEPENRRVAVVQEIKVGEAVARCDHAIRQQNLVFRHMLYVIIGGKPVLLESLDEPSCRIVALSQRQPESNRSKQVLLRVGDLFRVQGHSGTTFWPCIPNHEGQPTGVDLQ